MASVRQVLRIITTRPLHAAVTIGTVALSVGATAVIWSVVYGVLLRPLPYPNQERILRLSEQRPGEEIALFDERLSLLTYGRWHESTRTLDRLATYDPRRLTLALPGETESVVGAQVSSDFFEVFGRAPVVGRFFTSDEPAPAVVLGYELWRDRLGQDPSVIGQSLTVDGVARLVLGIAPAGFSFPERDSAAWTNSVTPINPPPTSTQLVIARAKAGVSAREVQAEGAEAARASGWRVDAADVAARAPQSRVVSARVLLAEVTASIQRPLTFLAFGVLILVCASAANLTTVWLSLQLSRQREHAIRVSIGATAGAVFRLVLMEAMLLTAIGAGLGILIAYSTVRWLAATAPPGLPRATEIALDWRSLSAAIAAASLMLVASAAVAATRGTGIDVLRLFGRTDDGTLPIGSRTTTGLHRVLLGFQTAVATWLIVGSVLLTHSFVRLVKNNPGYRPEGVLVAQLYLPATPPARKQQFLDEVLDRVRALPGVRWAGGGNMMPFSDSLYLSAFELGAPQSGGQPATVRATQYVITPGYAEALGLELREGRFFTSSDVGAATAKAMVNEEFVRRHFPRDPVAGRVLLGGFGSIGTTTEIVGVVGNVLKDGLDQAPRPEIYLLHREELPVGRDLNVATRIDGDPAALGPALRRIVRETQAGAAAASVLPLTARIAVSVAQPRFSAVAFAALAIFALLLACGGLYGSVAAYVSGRTVEMSIRYALGATRQRLIVQVLASHFIVALVGMTVGLIASAGAARGLRSVLFGISPFDVASFLAAPVVLIPAVLLACLIPAARVTMNDPVSTLRGS